jgi:hypothetical protein
MDDKAPNLPAEVVSVLRREALLRTLTLLEHHARNAREFLSASVGIAEHASNASPLAGLPGPDGRVPPSPRQVLQHNSKACGNNAKGHLDAVSRECQRFLGVTIEAQPSEEEGPAPAGKLQLA